jgi:hypothetical protein
MSRTDRQPITATRRVHRHGPARRTALALVTALALAGCGADDDADVEAADTAPSDEADTELDESTEGGTDDPADDDGADDGGRDDAEGTDDAADDATDGAAEPDEPTTFDPANEQRFVDVEFTDRMSGDTSLPFSNLVVPDELPWPTDVVFIQAATDTTEESEPVTNNNGAFRVLDPDADVDTVMGFFFDRLPELGWELDDEQTGTDALSTRWIARELDHPDEDFVWETELRVEYLGPGENRDEGALRWWVSNDQVRE